jgi:diacylglycerol kinase family enzyme
MREFRAAGVNTIVVNGGDGSLAAAVTEAYYCYGEREMPIFLPLRGGSFNAVAGNIGMPRHPRLELLRWLRTHVHRLGQTHRAPQLIEAATGQAPSPAALLEHLREKT